MSIRVVLYVPEILLQAGLRALLAARPEVDLRASGAVLERLRHVQDPDVVLVSASVGGDDDLQEYLLRAESDPGLLVIGADADTPSVFDDIQGRGWGWLPADANEEELLAALQAVAAGLTVQTPEIYRQAIKAAAADPEPPENSLLETLTEREREVLQLLARGLANKQIALALSISEHTVKFHVSSIYSKLNAANRTEAVRIGLQNGLISI